MLKNKLDTRLVGLHDKVGIKDKLLRFYVEIMGDERCLTAPILSSV